uniref:Uncharacterized protein n=1 Tax=Candidozyma auris TaxID=498019 RepID=A0A0L0P0T6_CANAR
MSEGFSQSGRPLFQRDALWKKKPSPAKKKKKKKKKGRTSCLTWRPRRNHWLWRQARWFLGAVLGWPSTQLGRSRCQHFLATHILTNIMRSIWLGQKGAVPEYEFFGTN